MGKRSLLRPFFRQECTDLQGAAQFHVDHLQDGDHHPLDIDAGSLSPQSPNHGFSHEDL